MGVVPQITYVFVFHQPDKCACGRKGKIVLVVVLCSVWVRVVVTVVVSEKYLKLLACLVKSAVFSVWFQQTH